MIVQQNTTLVSSASITPIMTYSILYTCR